MREPADLLTRPLLYHSNYPDNWRLWFAALGVQPPALIKDYLQIGRAHV